jgi:peptide/nickel transport system permease protein
MAVTTDVPAPLAPGDESARRPPAARLWLRSLGIAAPATLLGLVFFACFLLPEIAPIPAPLGGAVIDSLKPSFSPGHVLGTDPSGNDILARILHGGRSSLIVAVSVQALGLAVGGLIGALAAQLGGLADAILMRVTDVLIATPALVLVLVIAETLGSGMLNVIWSLAFLSVPTFARVARAESLRLREQPFMVAAKLSGTSTWRIVLRHLVPNIGPTVMTAALLGMGIIIIVEGALSFLGAGIPEPAPSWGNMIFTGSLSLAATPGLVIWPSLLLVITVFGFNQLGEALRARWSGR